MTARDEVSSQLLKLQPVCCGRYRAATGAFHDSSQTPLTARCLKRPTSTWKSCTTSWLITTREVDVESEWPKLGGRRWWPCCCKTEPWPGRRVALLPVPVYLHLPSMRARRASVMVQMEAEETCRAVRPRQQASSATPRTRLHRGV